MTARHTDTLAEQILRDAGLGLKPPIDVQELARLLGVDEIIEQPLVEDGRLEQTRTETRILVRRGVRDTRRRFTIAHELGHLLLADPTKEVVARRARGGVANEERFCDEFAAAVLLPHAWVAGQFHNAPERLATARRLATTCDASLSAAVVRLRTVLDWRRSFLLWRRDGEQWRLQLSAGVPIALHNRVRSAPNTSAHLTQAQRDRTSDTTLPLLVHNKSIEVPAEVSVGSSTALALVDLSDIS